MTKIASIVPAATKVPVYVTQDTYEIWYAQPISLGKIHKRKAYWYTQEGNIKFTSSRDAMEYMIHMHNLARGGGNVSTTVPAQKKVLVHSTPAKSPIVQQRKAGPSHPPSRAGETTPTVRKQPEPVRPTVEVNQNHPMFQDFLDFMTFRSRRKLVQHPDR